MTERESLDVSAKTVEDAVSEGLRKLNLSHDQVEITILNEGKRGIFGIGAEDATVRLTAKVEPVSPEPVSPAPTVEPVDEPTEPDQSPAPVAETGSNDGVTNDVTTDDEEADDDDETILLPESPINGASATDVDPDTADVMALANKHLSALLELMGIKASIETRVGQDLVESGEEPPLVLDLTGNDLGILIGRRSETLQALQYMVRLMVSKETKSRQRVVVDVESYRARRRSSLQQMATRMADRAVSNGERVVMEAMPAYDRRIIHMTLRDHPHVITKSVGREANRKVTIIPK